MNDFKKDYDRQNEQKIKPLKNTLKISTLLPIVIAGFVVMALSESKKNVSATENQWIVSVRNLTVQDGIDKEEAREFLESEYFPLFEQLPGVNAMIGTPDRGVQKGDFVLIYIFDSKWTRDYHFPEDGEYSSEIQEIIENPVFTNFLDTYLTQEGYENYQEYLMFARAK